MTGDNAQPDWEKIKLPPRHTLLGEACETLIVCEDVDLLQPIIIIGWRLGAVPLEEMERLFIESHEKNDQQKTEAALRLYQRIVVRVAAILEEEADTIPFI